MRLFQRANRQIRADGRDAEKLLAAGYVEIHPETDKPLAAKAKKAKAEKPKKDE